MPKVTPKALINLYAENEINPSCQPRPLGEIASGGQIGVSYDPEILLANQDQGISGSNKFPQGGYALPPAPDEAAWKYSISAHIKAMKETLAEYCPTQPYFIGSLIKGVGNIMWYSSKIDNNVGNPLTDPTKWDAIDITRFKNATTLNVGTVQMAPGSISNIVPDTNVLSVNLNLKAPLFSPVFTGTATVPQPTSISPSNQIATTMYAAQPFALLGTIVEEYIESGSASTIITEPFGVKKFLLNGQTIFQSQAPALFAKKGWSGSKVLQDRNGRFAMQVGNGYSIGGRGGSATETLTEAQLPIIRPKMQATSAGGSTGGDGSRLKSGSVGGLGAALLSDGGTFTITTSQSFGGGQAHNNLPPYVVTASYLIGW